MFLGSTVYSDRDGSERSLDGDDETAHTPRTIGTGASTGAATPALLPPSTAASTAARPPAADGASEDPPPKLAYALGRDAALSRYASPSPPPLAASAAGAEGVAPSARTSAQRAAAARASLPRVDSGFSSGDAASASSRSPCWPIAVGKGGLAPGLKNPGMASPRPLYHMLTAVPICLVHGASPPAVPTVLPNSAALSSALSRTLA
ncbi:hypothetical protein CAUPRSCDRAFT_12116 [Caulochytrium protostelioides]|uniref:Uncharacterized protein n=1 Tax=Caulochytrium protostelioides TaxID=1555241 RepID=A0A4P9WSG3_9FUNG|nr:hypothetical protein CAUPRSCDRAFT_12116 [Caulochytrium protostelioides]